MVALPPKGNSKRDAVEALSGYVYQIYQSALAWTEINHNGILWLEVSEDYLEAADEALKAVQVKETSATVTINSKGILASIDSFVELCMDSPLQNISFRYLTTSQIGKERKIEDRVGDDATLTAWRKLATSGDLTELRNLLERKNLSDQTKKYVRENDDEFLRCNFLRKIHFDCGAPDSASLRRLLTAKLSELVRERGGVHSQAEACLATILHELLITATRPLREERFVDSNLLEELLEKATHVVQNRAQLDALNALIHRALSASVPASSSLSKLSDIKPRPVSEIQLPKALAERKTAIDSIENAAIRYGICWIYGSAGMGKTVAARVAARRFGGDWATLNFRGRNSEYVARVLEEAANAISGVSIKGLLIDDLECDLTPQLKDNLVYLQMSADRSDVLLTITAPCDAPADFLFSANLPLEASVLVKEFSEANIEEILSKFGVHSANWAKYIHLISGGGHPQLAVAAIQSMEAAGWPNSELRSLKSLLTGNTQIEEVRQQTRKRLVDDLPEPSRRLLERLSLKIGGFKRNLALDLADVKPKVPDCGLLFDTLIGTWVDQHANDRFYLSPLLSNLATKTLSYSDQKNVHGAIATSLTTGHVLDGSELNAAAFSAWISEDDAVLTKICMVIFSADHDDLELIAQHLNTLSWMRTDKIVYAKDKAIGYMLRGAQLLLLSQQKNPSEKFWDAHAQFKAEGMLVNPVERRSSMEFMIYAKLLLFKPKQNLGSTFIALISKFDELLCDSSLDVPNEIVNSFSEQKTDGVTVTGFMFLNQCNALRKLDDLERVFNFLDQSRAKFRDMLLKTYRHNGYEMDILVLGAWLGEHDENTIDADVHTNLFARLEAMAKKWGYSDLAVCCCKYQATILNEYGSDKDGALKVLDYGMTKYGATNSELIRAKAKVLYSSGDHAAHLELSKLLIDADVPLNPVEKTFFGRDAAISAESEGQYDVARSYYLYASAAAKECKLPDMEPMYVGLLADAALASWLDGDRETSIRDFVGVLGEVASFEPDRSLRTAHCHAVVRHLLLWMEQDATGEKKYLRDGEPTKIYPGSASQPEPHKDIKEQIIIPIEMAWYMLARVECYAELNVGIMDNLHSFLPRGEVYEGQIILTPSKMSKALSTLDIGLFEDALRETVTTGAFIQSKSSAEKSFNLESVTFGTLPAATRAQQESLRVSAEQAVLLFASMCIAKQQPEKIDTLVETCSGNGGFIVRQALLERLVSTGPADDFYMQLAELTHNLKQAVGSGRNVSPLQFFLFSIKTLQMAEQTQEFKIVSRDMSLWLAERWQFIWEHQRFHLNRPALYEDSINEALSLNPNKPIFKVVEILKAFLPMLSTNNQSEVLRILNQMLNKK